MLSGSVAAEKGGLRTGTEPIRTMAKDKSRGRREKRISTRMEPLFDNSGGKPLNVGCRACDAGNNAIAIGADIIGAGAAERLCEIEIGFGIGARK